MKNGTLLIFIISLFGCNSTINQNEYLKNVSKNLDQIKSASYFLTTSSSAPGDTVEFSEPRQPFHKP